MIRSLGFDKKKTDLEGTPKDENLLDDEQPKQVYVYVT